MATWRVNNSTTIGGKVCAQWAPNTAYSLGARVVCRVTYGTVARRAYVYECTTAGTSHSSTEPTWPTSGTVNDNDVVWTTRSPDDGSWDNASCHLLYIVNHAVDPVGGDTILVDESHAESISIACSFNGATTQETPLNIICVDKDDSDSLSVGATVTCTYGASNMIFNDGALYSYGVTYVVPNYGVQLKTNSKNTHFVFEHNGGTVFNCQWGTLVFIGSNDYIGNYEIVNGNVDCSTRAYGIVFESNAQLEWRGGEFKAHASLSSVVNTSSGHNAVGRFIGVDFSSIPETCELVGIHASEGNTNGYTRDLAFINCKVPATFAGMYNNTPLRLMHYFPWSRPAARNCGNGNTVHELMEAGGSGTITHNTSVYNTSGASNGTTNFSMKMVSSDKNKEMFTALISTEIMGWTSSTTTKTFTIEGVWDSATNIQDDEIWMELRYPANNTNPLCAFATDRCAVRGTPADQTASSATWTTTGLTNPNKFKLSVTVTPGKVGPICARVYLAKPSTTVYVDPLITES